MAGFFDAFPRFLETSRTGSTAARLNARYQAIIAGNEALLRGRHILDIASHDGRWSFAALQSGCARITGIEARGYLVDRANGNMAHLAVPDDRFEFVFGDAFEVMKAREFRADTVLLLGFFYHTERHVELAALVAGTGAKHIILDTNIVPERENTGNHALVKLFEEPTDHESHAVGTSEMAVVGHPSREAIRMIFSRHGYSMSEFDWAPLLGGADLADYTEYRRSTFVLARD
jgi:predicted nicotinamide N-methyase